MGKSQITQLLLPLSLSDARTLLVFVSSSLTHKQTKTSSMWPVSTGGIGQMLLHAVSLPAGDLTSSLTFFPFHTSDSRISRLWGVFPSFFPLSFSSSSLPKHLLERKGGIKNRCISCGSREEQPLTQCSIRFGQTGSGFSISWYAPTAYLDISPEGKAFAFPLNSSITRQSTLIKNVESGFAAGSLRGFKREHSPPYISCQTSGKSAGEVTTLPS